MAFHCTGVFRGGQATIETIGNLDLLDRRETHIVNTQKDTQYIGIYISEALRSSVFEELHTIPIAKIGIIIT